MLAHANALVAVAYKVKMDGTGKPMLDKFGRPTIEANAAGEPVVADDSRAAELTRYVGLVDSVREIGYRLGYGPLGSLGGGGVPGED